MAVDQTQEWQADPAGRHRFRLYADGRPTEWVSNGHDIIVDPLPLTQEPPSVTGSGTQPPAADPSALPTQGEPAPVDPAARPAGWYRNAANPEEVRYWNGSEWIADPAEATPVASNGRGGLTETDHQTDPSHVHVDAGAPEQATAPALPADWYPDPSDRTRLRYWDGLGWTEQVLDERPTPRP